MLQRLALCRAFLHDPDLLLLDEPFDGLDVEGADLLQAELAERTGVTALVATHDPEALASRATARLAIA
jgi:ABC-type multidrug transport system ATPase subunit